MKQNSKEGLLSIIGDLADSGVLTVLADKKLEESGMDPIGVWEGQLKTELLQLPHHIRPAAEDYVEKIIGYTRGGFLQPDLYAGHIKLGKEEKGDIRNRDWHYYAKSAADEHTRMVEEANNGTDEIAKKAAAFLSESFNEIIRQVSPLDEGVMNRTLGSLFQKISRFPQVTSGNPGRG